MGLFREHSKAKTTKALTTTPTTTRNNNPHQASSTSRNSDASSSPNNHHNNNNSNNESSTLSSFSPDNGHSPSTTSSQQEELKSKRRLRDPKASKLRKLQRKQKLSRAISTPFRTFFHYNHHTTQDNKEEEPSPERAVVIASSSSPTRSAIHNETDYPCQMVADRRRSSYGKNKSAKSLIQLGVDLEREKTRLESFEAYVLVSILTASASFSVLDAGTSSGGTSLPSVFHHHPPQQYAAAGECPLYYYPDHHTAVHNMDNNSDDQIDWVHTLTMFAAGLSAICGLHATIVFSLCVLYGKTALGLKKDVAYDGFLRQVAAQRIRGFNTFSASLLLFAVECALLLYTHVPSQYALIALVVALSSTVAIVRDWYALVHAATTQIFQSQTDQAPGASQSFMEFSQDDDDEDEEEGQETNETEDEGSMRQKDSNGKEEREPLNGHHGHSIDNNKTARRRPKLHNEEDEDETESRTNQSKSKMVHYNDEDDDEEELDGSLVSGGR